MGLAGQVKINLYKYFKQYFNSVEDRSACWEKHEFYQKCCLWL